MLQTHCHQYLRCTVIHYEGENVWVRAPVRDDKPPEVRTHRSALLEKGSQAAIRVILNGAYSQRSYAIVDSLPSQLDEEPLGAGDTLLVSHDDLIMPSDV